MLKSDDSFVNQLQSLQLWVAMYLTSGPREIYDGSPLFYMADGNPI